MPPPPLVHQPLSSNTGGKCTKSKLMSTLDGYPPFHGPIIPVFTSVSAQKFSPQTDAPPGAIIDTFQMLGGENVTAPPLLEHDNLSSSLIISHIIFDEFATGGLANSKEKLIRLFAVFAYTIL